MDYKTTTANLGCCAMTPGGCEGCDRNQMSSYDWLSDIPESLQSSDLVEVQFKNTRKATISIRSESTSTKAISSPSNQRQATTSVR